MKKFGKGHQSLETVPFGAPQNVKILALADDPEDTPLIAHHGESQVIENPALYGDPEKRRSPFRHLQQLLMKYLTNISLTVLLLGGVIALIYFGVVYHRKSVQEPVAICLTPACVLAASELLKNMSPRRDEIDPCTSFDKYVCEGWEENHDLRADQDSSFTGTIMEETSQQVLRHVLESPYTDSHQLVEISSLAEKQLFNKLQDAYNACMNEDKIKEIGSRPLLEVLRQIEKLFPAVAPQRAFDSFPHQVEQYQKGMSFKENNHLSNTIIYLESIGVTTLVSFTVGADDKDPDSVVLLITAPRAPGLPSKEYYQDKQVLADYSRTIGQVLEALLQEAKPTSLIYTSLAALTSEDLVRSVVGFESTLAQATPATEDAEDVTKYYNPRSLEETDSLFPQLSIEHIVSSLAPTGYTPDRLIIGSPSYLRTLSGLLKNTTVETLQAYFVWKTVQTYASLVKDDAVKPLLKFNNQLQGKDPEAIEERWRTCVQFADDGLSWILSSFFIKKAFSEDAKDFGDHIVSDIKEQFIEKLHAAEWMSREIRKLGVEKVHNIVQKIGFPTKSPDVRNSSDLQEYYATVNISSTEFFQNAISVAQFDIHREWSALGKPANRDEWDMTVPTVNAYYNPAGNEIVFPAGIMQAPVFYDPSVPNYLSYGAFGAISGHELSHAFDSTGRHFDKTGNFTEWWDNKTITAFQTKAQCFVDQFHEFTVPGPDAKPLHVNGKLTLGENIADAGGLSASFAAWKQLEKARPSQLLPGLQDFSKDQVFFISYANWWCSKTRKESAISKIYQDPHAPMWARILGTMANSREFKESFGCAAKEPRCELW